MGRSLSIPYQCQDNSKIVNSVAPAGEWTVTVSPWRRPNIALPMGLWIDKLFEFGSDSKLFTSMNGFIQENNHSSVVVSIDITQFKSRRFVRTIF